MLSLKQELEQGLAAARRAKPARRCGTKSSIPPAEAAQLLERRGYRLSRNRKRATCPHCTNGRKDDFTVAVNGDLYCCHRCQKGGHVKKLRPLNTFGTPRVRIGKAAIKKRQFGDWLDSEMKRMGDKERSLARRAGYAAQAIQSGIGWPTDAIAWLILSDWYNAQRQFESFWRDASDKCGRLELYRQWRRGKG